MIFHLLKYYQDQNRQFLLYIEIVAHTIFNINLF